MSVVDESQTGAAQAAHTEQDLGPLAWVLDELRKSLEGASKAVARFVRDADAARASDLEELDTSALRIARQQLHQACGALEMVGLGSPALVLRGMESAVQRFVQRPELCTDQAAATLERASFALIEYLETVLAGKTVSAVALFPQYRDTQALAGNDKVHPADLWPAERRAREPEWARQAEPLAYGPDARALLDGVVLRMVKSDDREAAAQMRDLCLRFAVAQTEDVTARSFWKVAAGFFDAQSRGLIVVDLYVKRMASRVLLQYAAMAKGDRTPPARLLQDLLFFCAQARPAEQAGAALQAVRQAYGMQAQPQVDYQQTRFGRYDPAVLVQARKRITTAAETWSALAGGDRARTKIVVDQFAQVAESLVKLHPASHGLARMLIKVAETVARIGEPPPAELAMEVATSVLYLQAAFATMDMGDEELAEQSANLVQRLEESLQGAPARPLEPWMEELYRQASDHQTMGSVVGELRATLAEAERHLDQYFRNPADATVLAPVSGQMAQMRGVLSVLGLDQATQAMQRMRETVERLVLGEIAESERAQVFDKLGNSLGAMGFLIDMLSYQRSMARKLFVYDEAEGGLRILMGRRGHRADDAGKAPEQLPALDTAAVPPQREAVAVAQPLPVPQIQPAETAQDLPAEPAAAAPSVPAPPPPSVDLVPEPLPQATAAGQQALADDAELAQFAKALEIPAEAAQAADVAEAAEPVPGPAAASATAQPEPLPEPVPPLAGLTVSEDDSDDEILSIFLEEAREVVDNGLQALRTLADEPGNLSEQTTLRRAFHTLKGSSRMVGLDEFGEAGWAMEQMLNAWLAEQKPMPQPMQELASDALRAFGAWASAIERQQADAWLATPFRAAADAMRLEGVRADVALVPRADRRTQAEPAAVEAPVEPFAAVEQQLQAEQREAPEPAVPAETAGPAGDLDIALDFGLLDLDPQPAAAVPEQSQGSTQPETAEAPAALATDAVEELDFAAFEAAMRDSEQEALAVVSGDQPALPGTETVPEAHADALPELQAEAEAGAEAVGEVEVEAEAEVEAEEQAPHAAVPLAPFEGLDLDLTPAAAPAEAIEAVEASEAETPQELHTESVADEAPAVAEESGAQEPSGVDADGFKVVDGLRISAPLYNVYLNEADEWSRRLDLSLQQWATEPGEPVPDDAIAFAHSLAGSSATVGFKALSDLARLLEHALAHLQPQRCGTPEQVAACIAASDEVQRLLHQFAAGFLKTPQPGVEEALQALLALDIEVADAPDSRLDALLPEPLPQPGTDAVLDAGAHAQAQAQDVAPLAYSMRPLVNDARQEAELQRRIDEAIAHAVAVGNDLDDDIDALDEVDPDLFPIFEEEAIELLPRLGAALRRWHGRPSLDEARHETLRALHTLKGSARLAGAMRLGEMAHRLESAVERVDSESPTAEQIEPLLGNFDALQAGFDVLRVAGEQVQDGPLGLADGPDQAEPAASAVSSDATASDASGAGASPAPADAQPAPVTAPLRAGAHQTVRVRAQLLDRLISQAGEVLIARSRVDARLAQARGSLDELAGNLERLRMQLRDIEVQAESQMQSRLALSKDSAAGFDPLEFDRFTRVQELTRMMAESVNDVATVQRNLQRDMAGAEDDLVAQGRQARELQRDLLRTRMVEFDSLAERLYAVVRQTSKEMGKQVRLNILGGTIEMDRGMLDRMMPAFEHLLRNCVAHGIEPPEQRTAAGKPAMGTIEIILSQERNDVALSVEDDGAGLNLQRIRDKAVAQGLWPEDQTLTEQDAGRLIFEPGFTTATEVTGVAGRGIGMDVVRSEVNALGGRIETHSEAGRGSAFRLVLPLTTAVTQVVMLRAGRLLVGVPASLVEIVRRAPLDLLQQAYASHGFEDGGETLPFYWAGALWQSSLRSEETVGRTRPVVILRSASQRIALHVDEVLGNQEVVIKNLGPQLARLPGLTGMSVLASGAVVQIYNPVALANVYGDEVRARTEEAERAAGQGDGEAVPASAGPVSVPLVLVVDDSITVRRVTQRLLQREGYRVALAADGLQAMERLAEERPTLVLSDIEMPRMDGFDLLRNIRADEALRDLPVVMITSRIAQKHREMARQLGANHYLGKPYSDEELLGLIQHYSLQGNSTQPAPLSLQTETQVLGEEA
ncbi:MULTISPECIES: Hpt domain-containing protein [Delftia]|uniref:Hpt domain-containing protein n=1 Tax=Delftia TaxID=80865 RepID=UPI0009269C34|nr:MULTISPECIES: Hpt domain-containing protein [Delftia]MDH0420217.1 Hpt domain-containing protein [Delftia tsuruhatensis]OJX10328.1 MAG: hybrid sensor histidine kinase/response regulator [Delftia sp. 67-8]QFS67470.1 response regulator [Delftia tsuruhatensis]WON89107.1 Hpt domain-containing protein [Delftia sp. UGAL515B_04]